MDGTAGKLFEDAINSFLKATTMWKTVPIIVVITKSYSEPDRIENIKMVNTAFENQKKKPQDIISVVASTYTINETAFAPPFGITELIDVTNALMPVGKKAARNDLGRFKLNRKRVLAQSLVSAATLSAITVGASPLPKVDSVILGGIEVALINGLAKLYEIDNEAIDLFNSSTKAITGVTLIAKQLVSMLKAVPGIRLGASIIQAIVAGAIVTALGQGCIYIFEQEYTGEKSISDIDWVNKVMNEKFSNQFIDKVTDLSKIVDANKNDEGIEMIQLIRTLIMEMFVKDSKDLEHD